jgi:hypothetical protein
MISATTPFTILILPNTKMDTSINCNNITINTILEDNRRVSELVHPCGTLYSELDTRKVKKQIDSTK